MGFGCKCVIFAFFESHRLFLCFKEKTIYRAMHSCVHGPHRDMACASCRTSDPTTIRGLKHSYPYKTGLAVIISVKIFRIYVDIKEFSLTEVAWGVGERSDPTQVLGHSGQAPGSSPCSIPAPRWHPGGGRWEGCAGREEKGRGVIVRVFEN